MARPSPDDYGGEYGPARRRALIDQMEAGDSANPSFRDNAYQPPDEINASGPYLPPTQPPPVETPAPAPAPASTVPTDPLAGFQDVLKMASGYIPPAAASPAPEPSSPIPPAPVAAAPVVAPVAAPVTPGTSASVAAADPFAEQIRSKVMQLMTLDPNAASINDADLKPIADANRQALQRSSAREREQLAEYYAARGYGSSGAMDAAVQSGLENTGLEQAQFESSLVAQKLQDRRNQIADAMKVGAGILSDDQRAQLSMQLANIDAALRNAQIGSQERIAGNDTAARERIAGAQNDTTRTLGLGNLGLGFYGQNLQNQQFNDNLGYLIGKTDAELNRDAILALLGLG